MRDSPIPQKAFSFGWQALATRPTIQPDGFFSMREWQEECFERLKDKNFWLINAPMASGKTFEIGCIAAYKLQANPKLRVIVAVPQTIIGAGFQDMRMEFPDGKRFHWVPRHYLCADLPDSNTKRLLSWLLGSNSIKDPLDRILVCSHQTLVMSFQKGKEAFQNVLIVVDEAHHVNYAENEALGLALTNKIGTVVKYALHNRSHGIQLGLTTATFFRGDRNDIIPAKHMGEFTRYNLPYDEFLKSMEHMKSFSYDFWLCGSSFGDAVRKVFKDAVGKTIVYIPPVQSSFSTGDKHNDVIEIYKAIAKSDNPVVKEQGGMTLVKRGNRWIKVVNLVEEEDRQDRKQAIQDAHQASNASGLDVIIALGMFKEGANWKWANREIILGSRGSLTDVIQIIGRLFRDAKGKENVEVHHLLPFSMDRLDKEGTRESLNDFLKAVFASMLLEEVVNPVNLDVRFRDYDGIEGRVDRKEANPLQEVCGDEVRMARVLEGVTEGITRAVDADAGLLEDRKRLYEAFSVVVGNVLDENAITGDKNRATAQIWRMFQRRTVNIEGLDVGQIDFDVIRNVNPLEFLLRYASDACGVTTFREFRQAVRFICFLPFEEARAFVRTLGLKSVNRDWKRYSLSKMRPENIPGNPYDVYCNDGWVSWGDWLGTEYVACKNRQYRSLEDARNFVRSLHLKKQEDWQIYSKSGNKPSDIPSAPWRVYADEGWVGMADWLGHGRVDNFHKNFVSFDVAKRYAKTLGLKRRSDWVCWIKSNKPIGMPIDPDTRYRGKGWISFDDFLGTGNAYAPGHYISFHKARKIVRSFNLGNESDWQTYCQSGKLANGIPLSPWYVYKNKGWISMGDWLGTGYVACHKREYKPFDKARKIVRAFNIKSTKEWRVFCKSGKLPQGIPADPRGFYHGKGWISTADWLGTRNFRGNGFLSFEKARISISRMGIKSESEWRRFAKSGAKPIGVPSSPGRFYENKGWISWPHWLGKV